MRVATWTTLGEGERGWLTGSLGELAVTRDVKSGDVLHVRTDVVSPAVLHERNTALCALHESAALHARAETWRVVERAEGGFSSGRQHAKWLVVGPGVCVLGGDNNFTNLSLVLYLDPKLSMGEV